MTEAEIFEVLKKRPRPPHVGRRVTLTPKQRAIVLAKTEGTCHVCGIQLDAKWQADHVVPHLHGGTSTVENCLPICPLCNRLRWSYQPDVIQMIMRLGVYAKREIRHETPLGRELLALAARRLSRNKGRLRKLPTGI